MSEQKVNDVLSLEGYENIQVTDIDEHATYFEASVTDGMHEVIFELKVLPNNDLYRRMEGKEDWHFQFNLEDEW